MPVAVGAGAVCRHLTRAILAPDDGESRRAAAEALRVSRQRKERFFVGDKAGYSELEDIFLTLGGIAMWAQYRTARRSAPAGEDWLQTLIVLSERHNSWSQEEGLGLLLLIDRFEPGRQARFLGSDVPSPLAVLGVGISGRGPKRPASQPRSERPSVKGRGRG